MESSKMLDAGKDERQHWNNLYEIFKSKVERNRSNPLIIFHGKHVSYYSILSMADSLAESMKTQLNITQGDSVAICLPLSPQFFISFLALQKIGAVAVPLDPDIKTYELNIVLGLLKLKSLICLNTTELEIDRSKGLESAILVRIQNFLPFEKGAARTFKTLGAHAAGISKDLKVTRFSDLIYGAKGDGEFTDPERDPSVAILSASRNGDLQAMLFTPASMLNTASSIAKSLSQPKGRLKIASFLPPFMPASFQYSVILPILMGGTVMTSFERSNYYKTFFMSSLFDCDYMIASPWDLSEILRKRIPNMAIRSLKGILTSTYLLSEEIRTTVEKIYGTRIIEYYGLPEMLGVTHIQPTDRTKQKPGSPGVPIANVEAKILEEKTHEELEQPATGELYVKGPGLYTKLIPKPADSEEYFINSYFDTGDLASMDEDGLYYIEDRRREAITSHGILVSSREIETLIESVEGVNEVAVVGLAEKNANEAILAAVSSQEGVEAVTSRIMQLCRKSLSQYKIPQRVEVRKELPKSMSGKILKRQIIEENQKQEQ